MKLNELVCPACGLKCLVDTSYTSCDGCGAQFTASQSRSRDNPAPFQAPNTITWPYTQAIQPIQTIQPIQPYLHLDRTGPIWLETPSGPTATWDGGTACASSEASSRIVTN